MMGHFIKTRLGEYAACLMICTGIIYPVLAGFMLADPLSQIPPLGIAVTAVILAVIYLLSFNRLTVITGVALGAALAVAAVIFIQMTDPLGDEEGNSVFIFFLVAAVISILVFLLTRTRPGTAAAALIGILVFAGSYFLDFPVRMWMFISLLLGSGIMFLLKVCRISALKAAAGRVKNAGFFIQSAAACLLALGLAFGIFYAVIAPLSPPVKDLELISILRNMDIMEVFGVAAEREVYNPDMASGQVVDGSEFANEEGEDENENSSEDNAGDEDTLRKWLQSSGMYKDLRAISYRLKKNGHWYLLALVVIAVAAVFAARLIRKRIWREKVRRLSPEDGIINYYNFFMSRLKRTGLGRPETLTLDEYSDMMEHRLEPFGEGEGSFANLTRIYSRVYYGHLNATAEEFALFDSFYGRFHKNLREEIGTGRYLLKLFRI